VARAEARGAVVGFIAVALLLAACSSVTSTTSPVEIAEPVATTAVAVTTTATVTTNTTAPAVPTTSAVTTTTGDPSAARPYDVFVPSGYDGSVAVPLVVLLHGYTASGAIQESYLQFQPLAEARVFLYVHPDGTTNSVGQKFWNATDACCNLFGSPVDDSAYLAGLIERVQNDYKVDPKRIYIVGHSNGGFMSYRMACDHADRIAAIVSLAGATFADATKCKPSEPVSVLQIHGTVDDTIAYEGGEILGRGYPGAKASVASWATYDGCPSDPTVSDSRLDLEANIVGSETSDSAYSDCAHGSTVELWTIEGGSHVPAISPTFSSQVIDFLLAHPKP
jgi:polyhydroxybutyrate depolymerase